MKNDPDIEKKICSSACFFADRNIQDKKVEIMSSGVILEEKEAEQHECKSDLVKLERSGACILRTRKG